MANGGVISSTIASGTAIGTTLQNDADQAGEGTSALVLDTLVASARKEVVGGGAACTLEEQNDKHLRDLCLANRLIWR